MASWRESGTHQESPRRDTTTVPLAWVSQLRTGSPTPSEGNPAIHRPGRQQPPTRGGLHPQSPFQAGVNAKPTQQWLTCYLQEPREATTGCSGFESPGLDISPGPTGGCIQSGQDQHGPDRLESKAERFHSIFVDDVLGALLV